MAYFKGLIDNYPIISIEDPLDEDDFEGFTEITAKTNIQIVSSFYSSFSISVITKTGTELPETDQHPDVILSLRQSTAVQIPHCTAVDHSSIIINFLT